MWLGLPLDKLEHPPFFPKFIFVLGRLFGAQNADKMYIAG